MTALALAPEPPELSWEATLRAAIRPEFAVERYVAHPGDVLFGNAECAVEGCSYSVRQSRRLCPAHASQFRKATVNDLERWLALREAAGGPAVLRTRQAVLKCAVPGCPRSNYTAGLCAGHHQRWRRYSGRGRTLEAFIPSTSPRFRVAGSSLECIVPNCRFPRRPQAELCDHHYKQFDARKRVRDRRGGGYELADFVVWAEHPGRPVYSVVGLGTPLAAEIQFVLQCRSGERQAGMPRDAFSAVRQMLRARSVRSLLDLDRGDRLLQDSRTGPFLSYARDRLERLAQRASGQSEWDLDVWHIARLPGIKRRGCTNSVLSFEFCRWPWLRARFKRWLRWRLGTGISASTAARNLRGLQLLIDFCERRGIVLAGPQDINRELLEEFIVHLASLGLQPTTANRTVGAVRTFLDDCRRHDWLPGLDPRATYYREDYARRPEQLPRYLSEHVMAQLEANLDRLPSPTSRTAVQILIGTIGPGQMLPGREHAPERGREFRSVQRQHLDGLQDVERLAIAAQIRRPTTPVDELPGRLVEQLQVLWPASAAGPRVTNSLMQTQGRRLPLATQPAET